MLEVVRVADGHMGQLAAFAAGRGREKQLAAPIGALARKLDDQPQLGAELAEAVLELGVVLADLGAPAGDEARDMGRGGAHGGGALLGGEARGLRAACDAGAELEQETLGRGKPQRQVDLAKRDAQPLGEDARRLPGVGQADDQSGAAGRFQLGASAAGQPDGDRAQAEGGQQAGQLAQVARMVGLVAVRR